MKHVCEKYFFTDVSYLFTSGSDSDLYAVHMLQNDSLEDFHFSMGYIAKVALV